jgi:MFS family permease
VLHALGRGVELRRLAAATRSAGRWLPAAAAVAGGDFQAAADRYAEIGSLPDEAFARLRAAEQLQAAGRPAGSWHGPSGSSARLGPAPTCGRPGRWRPAPRDRRRTRPRNGPGTVPGYDVGDRNQPRKRRGAAGVRRSTRVAWGLLALWTAGVAVLLTLSVANGTFAPDAFTDSVPLLLAFAAFIVVGALIVGHRPGNAVGWVFAAISLLAVAGWFSSWVWYPTVGLALVFTPLLFPDGRLPSPRWRPVAWLAGAATAALAMLFALAPTVEVGKGRQADNPIGVAAVGNPERNALALVAVNLLTVLALAAVVSLVVRFRRSHGEERLQLKWFTYAAALLPLVVLDDYLPDAAGNLLFAAVISFLPVAAGIAILRYRLYEIDRLINRTLVCGLLTALLAAVYAGLVLALGKLFGDLGDRTPSWVVAAATLAVASLFQPARRRIQAAVDRRFNRRRYDAARTVETFSGRLREQVDLDTLSADRLAVVEQTVQPTRASLWLRPSARAPG